MSEFDDMIPEFIAESADLLEEVENGLLRMEQGEVDPENINTIFRAIHSMKGGAGFLGLTKIEKLAHRMEDLLNLIRGGDLQPSQLVTDSLLQALDVLNSLFQHIEQQDDIDISGPVRALEAALADGLDNETRAHYETRDTTHPSSGLPSFSVSSYVLETKLKQANLFYIHLDMASIEQRGLTPIKLINEMLSMGEIVDSLIAMPEIGDSETYEVVQVSFHVLYSTVLEADLLSAALKIDEKDFRLVTKADFAGAAGEADSGPEPRVEAAPRPAPRQSAAAAQAVPARRENQPSAPARAAAEPEAEPEEPEKTDFEYLTISLGSEVYGVDILSVQEIIGLPNMTRLPRSPEYVLGVMNLRGMVVPVLDMRLKLHMPVGEHEPVVVVVRVGEKIMGAVVDGVNDVIEVRQQDIQETPEFSGSIKRDYLNGLTRHNKNLVILLELDRLLAPEAVDDAA